MDHHQQKLRTAALLNQMDWVFETAPCSLSESTMIIFFTEVQRLVIPLNVWCTHCCVLLIYPPVLSVSFLNFPSSCTRWRPSPAERGNGPPELDRL